MTTRLGWDEYWMQIARDVASRSTCVRRSVGCVIVDFRNQALSSGYNGVASGQPHCNEGHPCPAAEATSGMDLDGCLSLHAEANALVRCHDVWRAKTLYVTTSPCVSCLKMILGTGIRRIVFDEEYAHSGARELWLGMNHGVRSERMWVKLPNPKQIVNRTDDKS